MADIKTMTSQGVPAIEGPDLIQVTPSAQAAAGLGAHPAQAAATPDAGPAAGAPATDVPDWTGEHPVDIRLTIPLGFGRYYMTIVCGRERRSDRRLCAERRRHPLITAGNLAFFFALGSLVGLSALALLNMLTASLYGQG